MTLLCSTVGFSCLLSHRDATQHLPSIYALAQSLRRYKATKDCEIISDRCTRLPYYENKTRTSKEVAFARSYDIILQHSFTVWSPPISFFLSPNRKAVQESSPWMYVTMMMTDQIPLDLPPPLLNGEVAMMPHMINVNGDGSQQVSITLGVAWIDNVYLECIIFLEQGFLMCC